MPVKKTSADGVSPSVSSRASEDELRLMSACSVAAQAAFSQMETTPSGLTSAEAEDRLRQYGPNELSRGRKLGIWNDIYRRLKSPLVIQLLIIVTVSLVIGESKSAAIVGLMVLLSVGLSFILDRRSRNAVEALGKRVQSRAQVLRDGTEAEVRISEIVPGDIVVLQAGSIIPADLCLINAKDFFVSQSALTGESMAVEKTANNPTGTTPSLLELPNACFLGSNVTSGAARGLVVNTGTHTVFGTISERLTGRVAETDFDRGVRSFTWMMIRFMMVMVCVVFFVVGLTKGNWIEALLFGLSIAVGLTPEMLPMIITVNLAKGALTMAKKKVIVKRLPAIQNFGAIDILCTDKTGTLTDDRVVLEHHVDITGKTSNDVLNYAYLNSFYQTGLRNLLDRAVLDSANLDVEGICHLVDELPFDFQRRRMSVVVDYQGDHVLICKGAVEEIYACCSQYQNGDEVFPLLSMMRDDLFEEVERLNTDGYRVLGIAYRDFARERTDYIIADEKDLILLGYIAFLDPPKPSSAEAIRLLNHLGVVVKVLTGDNGLVARKVCKDVGLSADRMIDGAQLAALSDENFHRAVRETNVFVKVTPFQKEQIVHSLRQSGSVVGFMGDGINDALALRAADVGISVDSAVDIAKDAADIILLEKSLLVLEEGIVEGRRVFANIIKYIRMGASSNFGNMFSVVGASYLFPFLPMQPVQVLTNNLLYDLSQTGIPTDNVDPELVARPLRWNIANVKRFMIVIGPVSSIFDYATFGLMWFFFRSSDYLLPGLNEAQRQASASTFQTGWFVESLLTQTLIVHIIRTRRIPFIGSRASLPMTITTLLIMTIGAWLPYSPLASSLGLVQLPLSYWLWITGFLLAYSALTHVIKTWFFTRFGDA